MSISRRGFLKSMLALAAAPAIVRAESLMPIFVPKREIETLYGYGFGASDFTIETWINPPKEGIWKHVAQVQKNGVLLSYIDGKLVPNEEFRSYGLKVSQRNDAFGISLGDGYIDELRVTSLARDEFYLQAKPEKSLVVPIDYHKIPVKNF